jgi:ABC-type glycerol-3-phosphate transport system substrate-binding protein
MKRILLSSASAALAMTSAVSAQTLTIATVNNGHMVTMQELSSIYEAESGVTLNWVTLRRAPCASR